MGVELAIRIQKKCQGKHNDQHGGPKLSDMRSIFNNLFPRQAEIVECLETFDNLIPRFVPKLEVSGGNDRSVARPVHPIPFQAEWGQSRNTSIRLIESIHP